MKNSFNLKYLIPSLITLLRLLAAPLFYYTIPRPIFQGEMDDAG